jgi:four helix bundle protein
LSELDTQIEIARGLGYLEDSKSQEIERLMTEVDKMLYGLSRSL